MGPEEAWRNTKILQEHKNIYWHRCMFPWIIPQCDRKIILMHCLWNIIASIVTNCTCVVDTPHKPIRNVYNREFFFCFFFAMQYSSDRNQLNAALLRLSYEVCIRAYGGHQVPAVDFQCLHSHSLAFSALNYKHDSPFFQIWILRHVSQHRQTLIPLRFCLPFLFFIFLPGSCLHL